jgi:hypothetical protein
MLLLAEFCKAGRFRTQASEIHAKYLQTGFSAAG